MPTPQVPDHECSLLNKDNSQTFFPAPPQKAPSYKHLLHCLHKSIFISERNPRCGVFYRSRAEVLSLKQQHAISKSIIIHPLSMFRLYYEMWMSFILIAALCYFPMEAAFGILDTASGGIYVVYSFIMFFLKISCLVDIVITFFTGYVNESEKTITMDPAKIATRYIFSVQFFSDLLSSLPDAEYYTSDIKVLRPLDMLNLLKITRIRTTYNYFTRTCEYFRLQSRAFRTVTIIFFVFLVFHWTACIHYIVPQLRFIFHGHYNRKSWIFNWDDVIEQSLFTKYVKSFYKATGYMLSIRFEQVVLKNWEEIFIGCLTYTIGKFFLVYVTVKLVQIFLDNRSMETKYMELMNQLDSYMDCKRFPLHMRRKIMQNYEYKYGGGYYKEDKIKDLLPEQLKREINTEVLVRLVRNVTIFQNLPQWKLQQVLAHLKPEIYLENDLIIKSGSQGDDMYFLYSGTVCVYTPSGKEVCHLKDGEYFGEITVVLKETTRSASVIALEICEVYRMSKRGFYTCFKDNKDLLKKIRDIASERLEMTEMYENVRKALQRQAELKYKEPKI